MKLPDNPLPTARRRRKRRRTRGGGQNPRAKGTNPRAKGQNPRAVAERAWLWAERWEPCPGCGGPVVAGSPHALHQAERGRPRP